MESRRWTPPSWRARTGEPADSFRDCVGTVGAAALDRPGNLAAGTFTGGLAYKLPGRVRGHIATPFNSEGMYRGFVREGGELQTRIHEP